MKMIQLGEALKNAPFFDVLHTTPRGQIAVMCLEKGEKSGPDLNTHPGQDQFLLVMEGEGIFRTETEEVHVGPGDCLHIPPGEPHQLEATSGETLKTIDFYSPPAY